MNNSKIHKKIHDVRKSINPPAALAKRIGINSANSSVPQKIKQAVSTKVFFNFCFLLINFFL